MKFIVLGVLITTIFNSATSQYDYNYDSYSYIAPTGPTADYSYHTQIADKIEDSNTNDYSALKKFHLLLTYYNTTLHNFIIIVDCLSIG